MNQMSRPSEDAVRKALMELKDEHAAIMLQVEEMVATDDPHRLQPILENLHGVLMKHFAHEEYPDGLYHTMGACTPEHRHDLRALVDDHFKILSTLRGMIERAKLGQTAGLHAEAVALGEHMRAHETHEHALAASLVRA